MKPIKCPYCKGLAQLVSGKEIYPQRRDLSKLDFWLCSPCNAYVGCHKGSTVPFGGLANAETRLARNKAHRAFDPFWKSKKMSRTKAYKKLAKELGCHPSDCHIGQFNAKTCKRIVEICNEW